MKGTTLTKNTDSSYDYKFIDPAIMRELEDTIEQWRNSQFFKDLQAWKREWYRVNPKDETEFMKGGE